MTPMDHARPWHDSAAPTKDPTQAKGACTSALRHNLGHCPVPAMLATLLCAAGHAMQVGVAAHLWVTHIAVTSLRVCVTALTASSTPNWSSTSKNVVSSSSNSSLGSSASAPGVWHGRCTDNGTTHVEWVWHASGQTHLHVLLPSLLSGTCCQ